MKRLAAFSAFIICISVAAAIALRAKSPSDSPVPPPPPANPEVKAIQTARAAADQLYTQHRYKSASGGYRKIIEQHAKNPDPQVAEEVARTRSQFAYSLARRGEYEAAVEAFQAVATTFRGDAKRGDDSQISLAEDAQYQAAVCLQADGREQEATTAFTEFVRANPSSPLVRAVTRRVHDMTDGELPIDFQDALDEAEATRERLAEEIMLERAMCGPEALSKAAKIFGIKADADTIAKIAQTTERGTSLSGLQRAAHAHGMSAVGLRVTHKGLDEVRLPSLLLYLGHYVVLEDRDRERLRVYDPADGVTTWRPKADLKARQVCVLQLARSRGGGG